MKVSVVIPLYNKKDTIMATLSNVALQLKNGDEVIVIDDGSTDNSGSLVRQYIDESGSERVRLYWQENRGVSHARNMGVSLARNEHVFFLDADDIWLPGALDSIRAMLVHDPSCRMYCLGHIRTADAAGYIASMHEDNNETLKEVMRTTTYDGADFISLYARKNIVHSSAVCVKRNALEDIGGFPEGVKAGEDIYVWLRLSLAGMTMICAEQLVVVQREPPGNAKKRDAVPYYMKWISSQKDTFRAERRLWLAIRRFIFYRGMMNCAGRALAGYRVDVIKRSIEICKIRPLFLPIGLALALCPKPIIRIALKLKMAGSGVSV